MRNKDVLLEFNLASLGNLYDVEWYLDDDETTNTVCFIGLNGDGKTKLMESICRKFIDNNNQAIFVDPNIRGLELIDYLKHREFDGESPAVFIDVFEGDMHIGVRKINLKQVRSILPDHVTLFISTHCPEVAAAVKAIDGDVCSIEATIHSPFYDRAIVKQ